MYGAKYSVGKVHVFLSQLILIWIMIHCDIWMVFGLLEIFYKKYFKLSEKLTLLFVQLCCGWEIEGEVGVALCCVICPWPGVP